MFPARVSQLASQARRINVARLFWAAMAAGHALPMFNVLFVRPSLSSAILLALCQAFFLLKLLDAPWLRIRGGRRAMWAFTVVVVLLHARVIHAALPEGLEVPGAWQMALIGGGLLAVDTLARRIRRSVDELPAAAQKTRDQARLTCVWTLVRDALLPPRFLFLERAAPLDRAPPLRAA